jgi:hypothetical protein
MVRRRFGRFGVEKERWGREVEERRRRKVLPSLERERKMKNEIFWSIHK